MRRIGCAALIGILAACGEAPSNQGLYGTTQVYERISSHLEWIESVIIP